MPTTEEQNNEALRASIAWSLQIADELEHHLIAAYLADALNLADRLFDRHDDAN